MKISGGVDPGIVLRQLTPPAASSPSVGSVAKDFSFSDVLKTMMNDVDQSLRLAEHHAIGALTGDVPLQKAVESVVQAEQKVQLTVAVRDKIVAAYMELTRMQI